LSCEREITFSNFGTPGINGVFRNPRHYRGFSKPHALLGVFRTPDINGGFLEPQALTGVFRTPSINGVFETSGKLRYFQGLLKTSGNPLATLVFLGEFQTPGKTISGG